MKGKRVKPINIAAKALAESQFRRRRVIKPKKGKGSTYNRKETNHETQES
jgi:stalled ribosome alternative rescue factor ArfA